MRWSGGTETDVETETNLEKMLQHKRLVVYNSNEGEGAAAVITVLDAHLARVQQVLDHVHKPIPVTTHIITVFFCSQILSHLH